MAAHSVQRNQAFCVTAKIHVNVIRRIRCQVNIDYHNQHESAALIGLLHTTSSVLPSLKSSPELSETNAERSTGYLSSLQRIVQGYLTSLQWRVNQHIHTYLCVDIYTYT